VVSRTRNLLTAQAGRADSGAPVSTPLRLLLGWAPPAGTVRTVGVLDVIPINDLIGRVVGGAPAGGLVAVGWDGHRRPEWVHRANLVTATVAAAAA